MNSLHVWVKCAVVSVRSYPVSLTSCSQSAVAASEHRYTRCPEQRDYLRPGTYHVYLSRVLITCRHVTVRLCPSVHILPTSAAGDAGWGSFPLLTLLIFWQWILERKLADGGEGQNWANPTELAVLMEYVNAPWSVCELWTSVLLSVSCYPIM